MNLSFDLKCQVGARFNAEVLDPSGNVKRSTGWFKNLILDTGLDRLGGTTSREVYSICRVGTSNVPPVNSDSGLGAQIASTATATVENGTVPSERYFWTRISYTFPEGAVVGNVSELGTGWHASNVNTLFSRALVKDSMGNPTTIPVLADEVLRVIWEFRVYWPDTDVTGTIANAGNIGGSYDWVARAALVNSWGFKLTTGAVLSYSNFYPNVGNTSSALTGAAYYHGGALGGENASPTGTRVAGQFVRTLSAVPYVNGSHTSKLRIALSPAQGNDAQGISAVVAPFGSESYLNVLVQCGFTPPLPKTALRILTVDIGFSWARRTT